MGLQFPAVALAGIRFPFARKKITSVKILSLAFKTDHHVMKDNNTDWKDTGSLFPKPEWKYGQPSAPVSITKAQRLIVEVTFEVNPADAEETKADVTGKAAGSLGSLVFEGSTQFKGGTMTLTAESVGRLPDMVTKLTGNIDWSVSTEKDGPFDAGHTFDHTIYVTIDMPISAPGREAGITQKRMEKAVELVSATGKATGPWVGRPLEIVLELMKKFPGYELRTDPGLPEKIFHPKYFDKNGTAPEGGAWPMADFIEAATRTPKFNAGECQAIVRFIRGVIKIVGCPGKAQTVVVFSDPNVGNGNTVVEQDLEAPLGRPYGYGLIGAPEKLINGRWSAPGLADTYPGDKPGTIFDQNRKGRAPSIGVNNFEACLKFTDNSVVKYLPGGVNYNPVVNGQTFTGYDTMDPVIFSFFALVFVSDVPPQQPGEKLVRVEQIVKRYRNAAGVAIP